VVGLRFPRYLCTSPSFLKKEVNALENDLFLGRVQVLLAGGRVDARGGESTHGNLRTMGYVENNRRDV
jgi:hypothetical protein